ncbi:patatin-like phospholipase family protein [Mesorhizobium sp. PL10]
MQIQAATDEAFIAGARPAMEDRQLIDITLANDAHGAFAWGVLDRLLDEPRLSFRSITASGFGGMEAAVLAYGLALGGRRGAKTALTNFWRRVSHASMSVAAIANPLKSILEQSIDIAELHKNSCQLKLNILASNARTDTVTIFSGDQLSIEAILAGATVPFLFPAVEINGDTYWGEGDFSALPPVQPIEAGHRLIVSGKPSGCMTPCADYRLAANAVNSASVHIIFDSHHRTSAALFTRPWTDWGELTELRDRGRQRAEDWLLADHPILSGSSVVDSKNRYV